MKKIHLLFLATSFIVFFSCEEKELEIEFLLDTPNEFRVSKGDYVDKIFLEWNNPPKTERIEIFRFDSTLNDYKSFGFSETSNYIDSSELISEAYYYYKIRVNNSSDELSDFTNYDYGYVSGFESPIITNIGYGISSSSIDIEWNSVNGADNYIIYRSGNNEDFAEIQTTNINSYSDSETVFAGKIYYYKVKAINNQLGQSGFSQPDSGYILENYSYTTSFGDFSYGYGIEFDENNKIYVSDNQSGIIKIYNSDYSFDKNLISTGIILRGLSWANDGDLLAVNSGGGRLLKIDNSGNITSDFYVSNSTILREVITDSDNNYYITDVSNNDIVKLNSSGEYVTKWKMKQVSEGSSFYTSGLEIQDNKIIAGGVNSSNYIEVYDLSGNFVRQWDFSYAAGYISQDTDGNLYFASFTNKVIKTDSNGKILAFIGNDKLQRCESVSVNSSGIVFASDENQPNKIHVFTKN